MKGDFVLVSGRGLIGAFVRLGQLLNGDASKYTHAYITINDRYGIEARPGGAGYLRLDKYKGKEKCVSNIELSPKERQEIVEHARQLRGTPYSYLDYLALALHRMHIRPKFITYYVTSTGHMICSQFVDECYKRAGVHLFDDGRLPQDVTPGDLAALLCLIKDKIEALDKLRRWV